MGGILLTTAHILGVILETLFYGEQYHSYTVADGPGLKNGTGMYVVIFGVSMYCLARHRNFKHKRNSPNMAIIVGGILLFMTATAVSPVSS